jgi:hypothetical protein
MRALALRLAVLLGLGAGDALAQTPPRAPPPVHAQQLLNPEPLVTLQPQIDALARQQVIQQNDLFRLEHQSRTRQNMEDLQALGVTPTVPAPALGGALPSLDVSGLASIPDAALAASNARVKAAAENRP